MKHLKKALSYSIAGSVGLSVIAALNGCGDQGAQPPQGGDDAGSMQGVAEAENVFLVIEQTGESPDTYRLVEKYPTSGETRAILRGLDGTERFLSEDELREIAEAEAAKVEEGTSRLTQDPETMSGGMSFGETILAAAVGSLIGGAIANSLMGNRNFQRNQSQYGGGRPTSGLSQPDSRSRTQPKSGFFGGNKSNTSSSSSSTRSFGG